MSGSWFSASTTRPLIVTDAKAEDTETNDNNNNKTYFFILRVLIKNA